MLMYYGKFLYGWHVKRKKEKEKAVKKIKWHKKKWKNERKNWSHIDEYDREKKKKNESKKQEERRKRPENLSEEVSPFLMSGENDILEAGTDDEDGGSSKKYSYEKKVAQEHKERVPVLA